MRSIRTTWKTSSCPWQKILVMVAVVLWLELFSPVRTALAKIRISDWKPLFQGIEHATGSADASEPNTPPMQNTQSVQMVRIDLREPNLRFFSTPHSGSRETIGQTTAEFLKQHRLQLAINASFFDPVSNTPVPIDLLGLSISDGKVVSPPSPNRPALCITAGNQATLAAETPVTFSTKGIHTAVAGGHMLLVDGKNITAGFQPSVHPRTAVGLTRDRQTMFWLVIDGRQPGYSVGATAFETGEWLLQLGAHEAIMLDGGGSSTLVRADETGNPVLLNRPIHSHIPGRQRYIGNHLGLYAPRLPTQPKK